MVYYIILVLMFWMNFTYSQCDQLYQGCASLQYYIPAVSNACTAEHRNECFPQSFCSSFTSLLLTN